MLIEYHRAPIEESRKWAVYYTTNLLFKIYFKLNSISLSKNILRSIQASNTDMPPLEAFPRSHIVTFKYYVGVIAFLEEDYITAAEHLSQALQLCQRSAAKNRELILTYLIPTRLLTRHILPAQILLKPYPRLQRLFTPLCACIKRGDLAGFDAAMIAGQDEFVKRRIYLTLERGRDIALRNLFRRMFLAGGPNAEGTDRRTRIPVEEFAAALQLGMGKGYGGEVIDRDEVECLIANMIYKVSQIFLNITFVTLGPAFCIFLLVLCPHSQSHPNSGRQAYIYLVPCLSPRFCTASRKLPA